MTVCSKVVCNLCADTGFVEVLGWWAGHRVTHWERCACRDTRGTPNPDTRRRPEMELRRRARKWGLVHHEEGVSHAG